MPFLVMIIQSIRTYDLMSRYSNTSRHHRREKERTSANAQHRVHQGPSRAMYRSERRRPTHDQSKRISVAGEVDT